MDEKQQPHPQPNVCEKDIPALVLKVIDLWQKRGKRIEDLTREDIEEGVQYKH
jgi:hypothetical protein